MFSLRPHWHRPIYHLRNAAGKEIVIDVTTSVSPGLPPNHVLVNRIIPRLKKEEVTKVLDFGAGSLRHTLPLLEHGFEVGAVDFQEDFARNVCSSALSHVLSNPRFALLEWPNIHLGNRDIFRGKFDAGLLIYVLQTIPKPEDRHEVLRYFRMKIKKNGLLFYCSRVNQLNGDVVHHRISDGYYMYPKRAHHSFYREFTPSETHKLMEQYDFHLCGGFTERGTDQMFLYIKHGMYGG